MTKTLDLREIPAAQRLSRLETDLPLIGAGEEMVIVSDHDPAPLFQSFDGSKLVRSLQVSGLESGPELWRVVVRASKGHGDGGCCGHCGGE